jgi:hypothetical protein
VHASEWIALTGLAFALAGGAVTGLVKVAKLETRFEEHTKLAYHQGEGAELREVRDALGSVREELAGLRGQLSAWETIRGRE